MQAAENSCEHKQLMTPGLLIKPGVILLLVTL